ncbi:MAG: MmgE/PrpD family protein [Betaproteobacteria bacterium]
MTIEAPLAEALEWLFHTRAPAAVATKARELMLDTFGCVLAAKRHPELLAFGKQLEAADPGSVASAAAFFAAAACWDEACEGSARAHGRPGLPVLAACNALSRIKPHTYDDVIAAYVVGYEIGGRIGESMRVAPGMHVDGAWPCFGVAAAVVRLLGGNAAQALAAVRIAACQMPYALYLPVAAGANARNTYLSHSAQLGMLAASSALAGIVAPAGALEELHSRALAGAQAGSPVAPPGDWLISEAYLKAYAAVRHVHYGAAAALALRPQIADRLHDISRIRLSTYAEALAYCSNRAPKSLIQAQFSISYGVACALAKGDLAPGSYDLNDKVIQELEGMVELAEKPGLARRAATLRIDFKSERMEHTIDRVPGDPSMPMSREEILSKFARYAGRDGRAFLEAPGEQRFSEISPA